MKEESEPWVSEPIRLSRAARLDCPFSEGDQR